ncbi:MAG: hypothetical protein JNK63_04045 [Chthonomonas sp.]|nr:hypothetical protein [Chthonomonas sp.]
MNFEFAKVAVGVVATLGLYSVLYRENKFYRLIEHIYIGLAVGFSIVALWVETLESSWWNQMVGTAAVPATATAPAQPSTPGYYLFALLVPIGLLGYTVFSKKNNWMSRIPIGMLLGFWGGQQLQVFWQTYSPQLQSAMKPVLPTTTSSVFMPRSIELSNVAVNEISTATQLPPNVVTDLSRNFRLNTDMVANFAQQNNVSPESVQAAMGAMAGRVGGEVYMSQAISNIIFLLTLLSVLTYFLFSFEQKGKFINGFTRLGRWLLMVGFGAIFGSTVMGRFALLIDRMYFVIIEFFQGLRSLGG